MSIFVYIVMVINIFLFLLIKYFFFFCFFGIGIEMGVFFMLFILVMGGFWGRFMWGIFWVWDVCLIFVFILFFIYLGVLCF